MANPPILSICIPTYNRGKILAVYLKKYFDNNNNDFEIVVVDNCSSDNSFEYLQAIKDNRFHLYKNDSNIGSYENGLKTLSLATGKYLMVLMDRDFLDMKNIDRIIDYLKRLNVSAGVFCPDYKKNKPKIRFTRCEYSKITKRCFNGNHPSGVFYNKNELDIEKLSGDLSKLDSEITAYSTDFVLSSLAISRKPFVNINIGFIYLEKLQIGELRHSFTYSLEKENIFFMPDFIFKVFENYIKYIDTLNINILYRYFIIKKLIKKMRKRSTEGYLRVLGQKAICEWYNLTEEFIEQEKQRNLEEEYFERLENSEILKNNKIYKFVVSRYLRQRRK